MQSRNPDPSAPLPDTEHQECAIRDVHSRIEELEGTVDTAQSVLAKAERVLSVADEVQERSRLLMEPRSSCSSSEQPVPRDSHCSAVDPRDG